MDRRQFLTGFGNSKACSVSGSLGAEYFTNARLRTHENKEVRFYEDLIKGKQVVINFMYTRCVGICPTTTANLVKVQKALKDRVGRDIFMYSISLKPEEDDPATLQAYTKAHGVKPGWLFLTGNRLDIDTLRMRLLSEFNPAIDLNPDEHTGMIRIINDPLNRWFCSPAGASVETLVQTVRWCDPPKSLAVRNREDAIIQARINKMQVLPTWLGSLADD
jgi:protein SCO1/2